MPGYGRLCLPFWIGKQVSGRRRLFGSGGWPSDRGSRSGLQGLVGLCRVRRAVLVRVAKFGGFLRRSRCFSLRFGIFRLGSSPFRTARSLLLRALGILGVFQALRLLKVLQN